MNTQVRCDCCGLMVRLTDGDDCPRCGYPVAQEKEERFLSDNIRNLQRVAAYGGASLPVATLIARYQQRQNYLWRLRTQQTPLSTAPTMPVQQQGSTAKLFPTPEPLVAGTTKPAASVQNPITPVPAVPEKLPETISAGIPEQHPASQEPVQPSSIAPSTERIPPVVPPKATRTFSFKAFFADQTINVVSSLGAFLILIGSLSFIVTTPDRRLSFFTLLLVHALFGIMGAITRRFKSFRIVSIIYTAIFALQVPLVGLAGYRLVSGTSISPSALVAIAAAYAAVVYSVLAIYQRFQPFVYLAAVSITVVDIALDITFNLAYGWWPSTLLLLALASLVCVSPSTANAPAVQKPWDIMFPPVQILMKVYVYASYVYVFFAWWISLTLGPISQTFIGSRFSIAFTLLLLFCWTCLFAWRSRVSQVLLQLPYVFLACVLAFAYASSSPASGYILVLTGIALLYHFIERLAHQGIQRVQTLRGHIEVIVLASVCVIPLIADAALPFKVFARAYGFSAPSVVFSSETFIDIVALLCGTALTGSIITSHTGWHKSPSQATSKWCWLLLLSGTLFYWGYNLTGLMLPVVPVWSALTVTCILLLTTIAVRRFTSAAWSDPLDILTLVSAAQTLLLAIPQGHVVLLSLLLAFSGITYMLALYQQRMYMFVLTLVFALLACIPLSDNPTVLLILCILLPLAWATLERFLPSSQWSTGNSPTFTGSLWTFPVLFTSFLYTLEFLSSETSQSVSTLGLWLHMPQFPIALELALLACIWYGTAIVARKKIGLVAASGLACLALFFPTSSPYLVLTIVAFGGMLMAIAISRFVGRDWGLPLYIVGLLAAFRLGWSGQSLDTLVFTSRTLLSFGVLIYLISMLERESLLAAGLRWLTVVFVTWSLYDTGLLSEYAWAPIIAGLGAAIGLGIRRIIPLVSPTFSDKNKLWSYAGPLYVISLVSATLMGLDGLLLGITQPFYGAIPYALIAYALIVYGVLWLEKYPRGLFLTAGFAIWGLLLMAEMPVAYCMAFGLTLGLVGLCCGRILKLDSRQRVAHRLIDNIAWNWPWYLAFLVAAVLTGGWNLFTLNKVDSVFLENGLLAFAVLAYVIVLVEELPLWLGWISAGFAMWSLIGAVLSADQIRLFGMALFCTFAGVSTRLIEHILPSSNQQQWWQRRRFASARLLYSVALVAAVFSGFLQVNVPFYAAVPCTLMFYGLIAYGVALWEQRPWFWFCVGFMIWGIWILPSSAHYNEQNWTISLTAALLAGVTLTTALLGFSIGRLSGSAQASTQGLSPTNVLRTRFHWNWPWYVIALVSLMVTLVWCNTISSILPPYTLTAVLALFIGLVFVLTMAERLSDLSLLVIGLAVWLIAQTGWATWQMACAYSLLCLLVFAGQLLWRRIPPIVQLISPIWLARGVSLSGLGLVIVFVITQGGLSSQTAQGQALAHSGVFTLCIGAILLYWLGRLLSSPENLTAHSAWGKILPYTAGLLLSLTIPWELCAFGQTNVTWLTLLPASYMIITSPFLLQHKQQSYLRWTGHTFALSGAILLLLPTVWSSFGSVEVFPTLLLSVESLLLLLLGTIVRIRFFVLSGAAIVVVSAIHLLFLQTLGIPTFLALTLSGMLLLGMATTLLIIRTRLATAWSEMN